MSPAFAEVAWRELPLLVERSKLGEVVSEVSKMSEELGESRVTVLPSVVRQVATGESVVASGPLPCVFQLLGGFGLGAEAVVARIVEVVVGLEAWTIGTTVLGHDGKLASYFGWPSMSFPTSQDGWRPHCRLFLRSLMSSASLLATAFSALANLVLFSSNSQTET